MPRNFWYGLGEAFTFAFWVVTVVGLFIVISGAADAQQRIAVEWQAETCKPDGLWCAKVGLPMPEAYMCEAIRFNLMIADIHAVTRCVPVPAE